MVTNRGDARMARLQARVSRIADTSAPVDVVDTLLKGIPHFLEQGPRYYISITVALTGLTIAAITRNERYHQFYAIYFLIHTIVISFAIFHTLV